VVGRLAEGAEADLVVLDLASTPAIAERAARAEDLWEAVFPTIMMGDDRAVQAVFVGGRQVAFGAATAQPFRSPFVVTFVTTFSRRPAG
jgi:guanine deaminase